MPVKRKPAYPSADDASKSNSGRKSKQRQSVTIARSNTNDLKSKSIARSGKQQESAIHRSNTKEKSKTSMASNKFSWPQPHRQPVYVVTCSSGYPNDGFHSCSGTHEGAVGVFGSEALAYAAAIRQQIAEMEAITGGPERGIREQVTTYCKGLSMKARFLAMRAWLESSDWFADSEVIECKVVQAKLFPYPILQQQDRDTEDRDVDDDDGDLEEKLKENLLEGLEGIKSVFGGDSPANSCDDVEGTDHYTGHDYLF